MRATLISKISLFVLFVFIFSLSNVHAQEEKPLKDKSKKERFTFGPKFSMNITNEWISKQLQTEYLPGADLGLFFRFSPSRIYIQPEINLIFRYTQILEQGEVAFNFATHHIDIPIFIGVKVIDFKNFKIRLFVAPDFNIKFPDSRSKYCYQLGFVAGLGFDVWRFTIDAGYSLLGTINSNSKTRNNIVKVGIGFKCF